jgi:O-antigen ligase
MLPFFAVFFSVSQQDQESRFRLAGVVIGLGALALLVGFIQALRGPNSDLQFFGFTISSEVAGFFANRNHFAAQLYTTLIFAAVWFACSTNMFVSAGTRSTPTIIWFVASAIFVIALLAGLALARSRAGLLLSIAAVAGIVVMFFQSPRELHRPKETNRSVKWLAVATLAFAMIFAIQFGLHRFITRFEADPLDDYRFILSPTTLGLAFQNMPFGTGLGSFVEIYANNEKTQNLFNGYANRAHNDWAEFLLEAGIFGAIIASFFLAWFVIRTFQIWQQRSTPSGEYDFMLQRGGSLVILLLLAHSLVDYPLRTTAISVIFAYAAALLVQPPTASRANRFPASNNPAI